MIFQVQQSSLIFFFFLLFFFFKDTFFYSLKPNVHHSTTAVFYHCGPSVHNHLMASGNLSKIAIRRRPSRMPTYRFEQEISSNDTLRCFLLFCRKSHINKVWTRKQRFDKRKLLSSNKACLKFHREKDNVIWDHFKNNFWFVLEAGG